MFCLWLFVIRHRRLFSRRYFSARSRLANFFVSFHFVSFCVCSHKRSRREKIHHFVCKFARFHHNQSVFPPSFLIEKIIAKSAFFGCSRRVTHFTGRFKLNHLRSQHTTNRENVDIWVDERDTIAGCFRRRSVCNSIERNDDISTQFSIDQQRERSGIDQM